jgi:hypothetical protein
MANFFQLIHMTANEERLSKATNRLRNQFVGCCMRTMTNKSPRHNCALDPQAVAINRAELTVARLREVKTMSRLCSARTLILTRRKHAKRRR